MKYATFDQPNILKLTGSESPLLLKPSLQYLSSNFKLLYSLELVSVVKEKNRYCNTMDSFLYLEIKDFHFFFIARNFFIRDLAAPSSSWASRKFSCLLSHLINFFSFSYFRLRFIPLFFSPLLRFLLSIRHFYFDF